MNEERKPLSKKMRFDVFKRDSFTCQYCGSTPPTVVLEVDHIHPVSKGGRNMIDNLITACFDCNRGKAAGLLSSVPASMVERAELLKEKIAQVKAYEKILRQKRSADEEIINSVEDVLKSHTGCGFTQSFRQSVLRFLDNLTPFELCDYMERACDKRPDDADAAVKYFCGICWNIIKDRGHGAR